MKSKCKILFMGTPKLAATILEKLIVEDFNIIGVISQPDKEVGRGRKLSETPTKNVAKTHDIPVFQPTHKNELLPIVKDLNPDIVVVAAYGKIIPEEVLNIPKYGTINVHGSLLPKYRGASCVAQAILEGEEKTGVTIMEVSREMDAGNIITQIEIPIAKAETTESLMDQLADKGAALLVETLPKWPEGSIISREQNHNEATYCTLIKKEDGFTNFSEPAEIIERKIRAYQPWPLVYFKNNDKTYKIYKAKVVTNNQKPGEIVINNKEMIIGTSEESLSIEIIQPEGKKPMKVVDFLNGYKL